MRLGKTQKAILLSLSFGEKTVEQTAMDWPHFSEAAIWSAMQRLYTNGLVEPTRFDGSQRVYEVTGKGLDITE